MEKEVSPRHDFHVLIAVFAIILFVFILFLSLTNGSDIGTIMLGLLPTIAYLIINYSLLYDIRSKHFLVWILPVLLVLLFYLLAKSAAQTSFGRMDLNVVAFLNLFICYIFAGVILFYIFVGRKIKEEKREMTVIRHEMKNIDTVVESLEKKPSVQMLIHSLEDKCKAINFVIGRVYSDKHGGSKELREKIRIQKDWYNTFSGLSKDFSAKDREMVHLSVDLIHKRLMLLEKKEKDVFGNITLLNVDRDPRGHEPIREVLIKNDKDPVETYLGSARQMCERILALN
jgi:hypothetical protein